MKKVFNLIILVLVFNTLNSQTVIQNGFAPNTQLSNTYYLTSTLTPNTILTIDNHNNSEINSPYTPIQGQEYTVNNAKKADFYSEFKQFFNYSYVGQYDSISITFTVKNIKLPAESRTRYYVMEGYLNTGSVNKKAYWQSEALADVIHTYTFKFKTSNNLADTIRIRYAPSSTASLMYPKSKVEIYDVVTKGISNAVGVSEYSKNNTQLSVFPNPSNGDVNVKFNASKEKSKIEIFDIQGRLVQENDEDKQIGENIVKLHLEDLSSGIYIVRVENKTFKITLVK